jgi:hypothetical protein
MVDAGVVRIAGEIGPWVRRLVRVGYAAKGLIYVLIGVLAFRVAVGAGGGRLTDARGALASLRDEPFGQVLLAVLGGGLLAYGAWQLLDGLLDARRRGRGAKALGRRAFVVLRGVVYGGIGWQAARLVLGAGAGGGGDARQRAAGEAQQLPMGEWLLVLAGIGVAAYGVMQIVRAARNQLGEDLQASELRHAAGHWAVAVSRAGIAARGLVFIVVGWTVVQAARHHRSSEVAGTRESLGILLGQPGGELLLAAVALGLVGYGVYQFLHARYARL